MAIRVILFRHGDAGDSAEFSKSGQSDVLRPLTDKGRRDVTKMSKALAQLVGDVDVLASSSLVRAKQTQKLVLERFPLAKNVVIPQLKPNADPAALLQWLRGLGRATSVILVGHEPHLSRFLSFILTGKTVSIFDIKKGGIAIVEFQNRIAQNDARLKCLLQPSQVKKIRKS